MEDPLDDAGLVQQQLDQLSTIGRCEYEKTCALLVQLFDQAAQTYQELLQSTNSSSADITVQEGTCCTHANTEESRFHLEGTIPFSSAFYHSWFRLQFPDRRPSVCLQVG